MWLISFLSLSISYSLSGTNDKIEEELAEQAKKREEEKAAKAAEEAEEEVQLEETEEKEEEEEVEEGTNVIRGNHIVC